MKTVIITGSRDYTDRAKIQTVLCELEKELGDFRFVDGKARGADTIGFEIYTTVLHQRHYQRYAADWKTYGKAAGPIRNKQMLDAELLRCNHSDIIVIAFPLAQSKGTYDMITYAQRKHVEVRVYD